MRSQNIQDELEASILQEIREKPTFHADPSSEVITPGGSFVIASMKEEWSGIL